MKEKMRIRAGAVELEAELAECESARKIFEALPLRAAGRRWGDEIYFQIPVVIGEGPDAREEMEVGELGYWPPGKAFCIFFGPTPASVGHEPRAASRVNPVGRIVADARRLSSVGDGAEIVLEKLEPSVPRDSKAS